jgi:hypothetical protein
MPQNLIPPPGEEQEPEKYSLEEMMERLKERGHEEGELVTRADGTQAIKVRKKKRRSKQPHKEQEKAKQRLRIIKLGIVFMFLTMLVIAAAAMLFYYNSSSFREDTRGKIATWTAAETDMAQFSVTPTSAKMAFLSLKWPEGNHLRQMQLSGIEGHLDFASFFQKQWGGTSVVATSGTLVMSSGEFGKSKSFAPTQDEANFPFSFGTYRCEKLNVAGYNDQKQPWLQIEAMDASLIKTLRGSQCRLVGGKVKVLGLQAMQLDRATMHFELGQLNIENLRFKTIEGAEGILELKNSIDLYSKDSSTLEVTLNAFPLDLLIGDGLAGIVSGTVETKKDAINRVLSFVPGNYSSSRLLVGFAGCDRDPFVLKNLPFLNELSRELQDQEYAKGFIFDDRVEGEIQRTVGETQLQGLLMEKKGQFILKGQIKETAGVISGELEIGLSPSVLNVTEVSIPMKTLFADSHDGYQWCVIKMSGTSGAIKDNFDELLKAASASSAKLEKKVISPQPSPSIEGELDGK